MSFSVQAHNQQAVKTEFYLPVKQYHPLNIKNHRKRPTRQKASPTAHTCHVSEERPCPCS